jgi:multisubunit Na+/H+ antiporter MnhG subunit
LSWLIAIGAGLVMTGLALLDVHLGRTGVPGRLFVGTVLVFLAAGVVAHRVFRGRK